MSVQQFETKAAFARRLGCSRQNVQKLAARGLPVAEDGRVEVEAALAWMRANLSTATAKVDGGGPSLTEAKTRVLLLQAERVEVEIERLKGSLISKEAARRAVRQFARNHRDHMLRFAARHGPGIAAELGVDAATLVGLVEARIREALNEAADNPVPFDDEPGPA